MRIRFADGRHAAAPVALCEVQGYAYEAATHGADLLDAFGVDGGNALRDWATALASRFRERFWIDGRYPAIALDGSKTPVDSLTSNIGHLLGTGILDDAETARIAERVTGPELNSGFGLRTMSSRAGGFSPLSYHCGSVWPHDTAIVIRGLAASGHAADAVGLISGLVSAGAQFGWRLPELYSGDDDRPIPYPAACRPQAWAAAASIVIVQTLLGLEVDVPRGTVRIRPVQDSPFGHLRVTGLRAGGEPFAVAVDDSGTITLPP